MKEQEKSPEKRNPKEMKISNWPYKKCQRSGHKAAHQA